MTATANPTTAGRSATRSWVQAALIVPLLVGSLYPNPTPGVPLVQVAAVALAPLTLWAIIRGMPILHRSVCLAIVLAAGIAASWYLIPPTTTYGQTKTSAFFTLTLFTAVVAVLIRDRLDLTVWAKVWVLSGLALAVLALTGSVDAAGRAVGEDMNPIWLARAIGSPGVALLWLAYQRAVPRKAAIAAGVVLAAGLLATGSRGPFAATAVGVICVIACSSAKDRALKTAALAASAATALYVVWTLQVAQGSRIGQFVADPTSASASSDRLELARPTLDVIAQHPGGVGLGNWRTLVPAGPFIYPHNLWLEALAEAGWVIGALLIAVTVRVLFLLWKTSRVDPSAALMLGLLAFEVVSVSVSGDLNARTFYFVLATGFSVINWRSVH